MSGKADIGHDLNRFADTLRVRLIKGVGANLVGQSINIVSRLTLPPLFLHAWGVDIYGEWLLLSSFVSCLSLSDMGGQLYVVNRLTQAYTNKDMDLFRTLLRTGLAVFLVVPSIFFLGFVLFINLYHVESIFKIVKSNHQEVLWILIFLAFSYFFIIQLSQMITIQGGCLLWVRRLGRQKLCRLGFCEPWSFRCGKSWDFYRILHGRRLRVSAHWTIRRNYVTCFSWCSTQLCWSPSLS